MTSIVLGLLAASAQAGAPGPLSDTQSVRITPPMIDAEPGPRLYAAEIRNAVSVRMDTLAEQGIAVDREAVDGIGLEAEDDRLVEISDVSPQED